jgi:hypothetical protein
MEELELGTLVAMALDDEACGYGPLFDFMFACTTSINNILSVLFTVPYAASSMSPSRENVERSGLPRRSHRR